MNTKFHSAYVFYQTALLAQIDCFAADRKTNNTEV